jgi:hypothetical protein
MVFTAGLTVLVVCKLESIHFQPPFVCDGDRMMRTAGGVTAQNQPPSVWRRRGVLSYSLALVGILSFSYLLGAAVIYFELPSSAFLKKAFGGARAWKEREEVISRPPATGVPLSHPSRIDKPGKTCDGFTLCTYAAMGNLNTQAFLLNMRGDVVHKWSLVLSQVWPNSTPVQTTANDSLVGSFGCYLYPNGDLLVVLHGMEQAIRGHGLIKLDKDSKVLWAHAGNVHHDVDVAPDGTIYAVEHASVDEMPKGLDHIPTPTLVDSLVKLSRGGKPLSSPIPLLEAFRDSRYASLLDSLAPLNRRALSQGLLMPRLIDHLRPTDALHTNCVHYLTSELAPRFPLFKAGQVLISMRHLDAIAVVDPDKKSVVWAARGPWQAQHDAHFLPNGHILIYDNLGSPLGTRVLEYDPTTQAFPWSYSGENHGAFFSDTRGMSQRLPNGNTLVVNSQGGELLEVTPDKEVVWTSILPGFINFGRRYRPEELHFLKGDVRARP